jgi:hypothetical protein
MKIAIIGAGSAGIQAACYFLSYTPQEIKTTIIYDPNIPILGIGESTNPTFLDTLTRSIDFMIPDQLEYLDATLKFGTFFSKWRKKDFLNPLFTNHATIHFNTFKLQEYVLPNLHKKWGNKFEEIKSKVIDITQENDKVTVYLENTTKQEYDYVMDCRGFPKNFATNEYNLCTELHVNHALIHNIDGKYDWYHTKHIATPDGWMFGIPLQSRKSYGYLYNDTITTKDDAKTNFSVQIGVPIEELDNIEYKFQAYWAKQILNGRIIKNGNNAIFFEPVLANSLTNYYFINQLFLRYITKKISAETLQIEFNAFAQETEDLIHYIYHGGSTYDTLFWQIAKEVSKNKLKTSKKFKEIYSIFFRNKNTYVTNCNWRLGDYSILVYDKNFEYNYFSNNFIIR